MYFGPNKWANFRPIERAVDFNPCQSRNFNPNRKQEECTHFCLDFLQVQTQIVYNLGEWKLWDMPPQNCD